jgi:hypothetical protein
MKGILFTSWLRWNFMVALAMGLLVLGTGMAAAQWPVWDAGDLRFGIPKPGKANGVSAGGHSVGALGMLLIIGFQVENLSNTDRSLDLTAFTLTDPRGRTYRPAPEAMDVYGALKTWPGALNAQVIPGNFKRSLAVIFDVSFGDHDFMLAIPGRRDAVPLHVL